MKEHQESQWNIWDWPKKTIDYIVYIDRRAYIFKRYYTRLFPVYTNDIPCHIYVVMLSKSQNVKIYFLFYTTKFALIIRSKKVNIFRRIIQQDFENGVSIAACGYTIVARVWCCALCCSACYIQFEEDQMSNGNWYCPAKTTTES